MSKVLPKKISKIDVKDKILDGALTIFAKHGFEGARTRDIAALAQVNISTLHYHFKSKDKIYSSVIEVIRQRSQEIMMPVTSKQYDIIKESNNKKEIKEAIKIMAIAFVEMITDPDNKRMARIVSFEQSEQSKHFVSLFETVMKAVCDPFLAGIAKIINKRSDSLEVLMLTHSLHGITTSFHHNKSSLLYLSGWKDYNKNNINHIKKHIGEMIDNLLSPYI